MDVSKLPFPPKYDLKTCLVKFLQQKEYPLGSSFAVLRTVPHIHLASRSIQDYLIKHSTSQCDYQWAILKRGGVKTFLTERKALLQLSQINTINFRSENLKILISQGNLCQIRYLSQRDSLREYIYSLPQEIGFFSDICPFTTEL